MQEIVFDPDKIETVPIGKIKPNDWNPKDIDTVEYQRVKKVIEQKGLRLPIIVRENDGYEIIDGEQRWRICTELGYTEMLIYNEGAMGDQEARELTIAYEQQVPFVDVQLGGLLADMVELYDNLEIPYNVTERDEIIALWDGIDREITPVDELWEDMPEFEQDDDLAYQKITVHFATQQDVDEFAEYIGQKITDKTRYVYIPELEKVSFKEFVYIDES